MKNIIAIGRQIAVKPLGLDEAVTEGGIILSKDRNKHVLQQGEVLSVGTSKEVKDFKLVAGDKILYQSFERDEFTLDNGNRVVLVRDDQVYAKYED